METYRSGHNELDSKSSCPNGHVGSNPTVSAMYEAVGFAYCFLLYKPQVGLFVELRLLLNIVILF